MLKLSGVCLVRVGCTEWILIANTALETWSKVSQIEPYPIRMRPPCPRLVSQSLNSIVTDNISKPTATINT